MRESILVSLIGAIYLLPNRVFLSFRHGGAHSSHRHQDDLSCTETESVVSSRPGGLYYILPIHTYLMNVNFLIDQKRPNTNFPA